MKKKARCLGIARIFFTDVHMSDCKTDNKDVKMQSCGKEITSLPVIRFDVTGQ